MVTPDKTKVGARLMMGCLALAVVSGGAGVLAIGWCASRGVGQQPVWQREITPEHQRAIEAALSRERLPAPTSLEISSGYLVATFELHGPVSSRSLEATAERAILAIRNTMVSENIVQGYRVTLNGPPPGPGLIRRYGSARFHEGGSIVWKPAK